MSKKFVASLVVVALVIGVLLGVAGGSSFVIWKVIRFETDAIVMAVAERTFSLVPVVIALGTEKEEERLNRFESAARSQLTAGIVALHSSLPMLSEEKLGQMEGILKSISRNREKLALGQFDSPPLDHIEEILVNYSK